MQGIKLDGVFYDVNVAPASVERAFALVEGNNGGATLTGRTIRDVLGSKYDFKLQFEPNPHAQADYDSFYEAITAPVESHIVELPYAQGVISFEAAVVSGTDEYFGLVNGFHYWGHLTVEFNAVQPQRY